jgi:hypothetical protein
MRFEKRRECPHFIASLDLFHVIESVGIERLRPMGRQHDLRFRARDFLDALRRLALPINPAIRKLPPSLPVVRLRR